MIIPGAFTFSFLHSIFAAIENGEKVHSFSCDLSEETSKRNNPHQVHMDQYNKNSTALTSYLHRK